uniref:Sporulation protein YqfD n=1 Tax=Eubacterium plexicaudatum ASF492 TaxID=1235802 RepID=N2BJQ4_9FIRM
MLLRLIKYFRGYVEVALQGYAPERFFNLCSNHNILIWDLRQEGDVYYFHISVDGFRSLKPLLKKSGTHVKISRKNGIPFFFFRYRKRKILFLSVFICMMILYTLSRFIWKIRINGNDSVTDDSLLQFLEEKQSSYGTPVSDIDCTKLEEEIRSRFKSIIWTSVKREGTTLTIDVQENLVVVSQSSNTKLPEDFQEQKQVGYDLTALHDGTIESIYVRKGTPLVRQGDTVKKGDVLVSGALPIYDDSGTLIDYQYRTADADIQLRTDYAYRDRFSAKHTWKKYSGRSQNRYGLSFSDTYFQLPWKKTGYEQYTVMDTRTQVRLCDSFYLPIYLVRRTYEEYEEVESVYTKKEAKQQAAQHLTEFLEKLTQKGVLILEKHVMIRTEKNKYTVSGTITVLENTFQYVKNAEKVTDTGDEGNVKNESE